MDLDALEPPFPCPRGRTRTQCSHALALEVLGGLAGAWRAAGDPRRARRASALRLPLPVDGGERRAIRRDLERLEDGAPRAGRSRVRAAA